MNILEEIFSITHQIEKILESNHSKEDREDLISQVDNLLDGRQHLLEKGYSENLTIAKEKLEELNILNTKIIDKLNTLKFEVQSDINAINQQKQTRNAYVNPYQNISFDGMYYDKKK
ncbi:MAG: flagellar FliT family protein [Bacillales bacterium]|jgi:flagellar protein FliT|nr:flagellar FliT family protein [Bacillales bacterium]